MGGVPSPLRLHVIVKTFATRVYDGKNAMSFIKINTTAEFVIVAPEDKLTIYFLLFPVEVVFSMVLTFDCVVGVIVVPTVVPAGTPRKEPKALTPLIKKEAFWFLK